MLSHRESAYCPTCRIHSSQERVKGKRGVRYCGGCGNYFTLKESRQAERDDLHIAAVDFKYDQQEVAISKRKNPASATLYLESRGPN